MILLNQTMLADYSVTITNTEVQVKITPLPVHWSCPVQAMPVDVLASEYSCFPDRSFCILAFALFSWKSWLVYHRKSPTWDLNGRYPIDSFSGTVVFSQPY